jgi:hypothetical protein
VGLSPKRSKTTMGCSLKRLKLLLYRYFKTSSPVATLTRVADVWLPSFLIYAHVRNVGRFGLFGQAKRIDPLVRVAHIREERCAAAEPHGILAYEASCFRIEISENDCSRGRSRRRNTGLGFSTDCSSCLRSLMSTDTQPREVGRNGHHSNALCKLDAFRIGPVNQSVRKFCRSNSTAGITKSLSLSPFGSAASRLCGIVSSRSSRYSAGLSADLKSAAPRLESRSRVGRCAFGNRA